ncbi:hypothetical protein M422DRAFT_259224, partial [Sphaerobolus stellatus SS14]
AVCAPRYISDRFLPDRAIDLVDEAASALRLAQESKPDELEKLNRERRGEVERLLSEKKIESQKLNDVWQAAKGARLLEVQDTKRKLEEAKHDPNVAQREGHFDTASRLRYSVIPELEAKLPKDDTPPARGAS